MFLNIKLTTQSLLILLAATTNTYAAGLQPRIVGGDDVDISAVPSTVALIDNNLLAQSGSFFLSQFCGGTVIAARWVLTAAHCLINEGGTTLGSVDVSVLMGSTDLDQPVNQAVGVVDIIVHDAFDYTFSGGNDIALLHLEYDALVSSIPIDNSPVALNELAFIAGWGALQGATEEQGQIYPTVLQGTYVPMIPGASCGDLFPIYAGLVSASQVCAGYQAGGKGVCYGDSGGPLYRVPAESSGQGLALTGITSWGEGCAESQAPGVFTSVRAYSDWIGQRIGNSDVGSNTVTVSTAGSTPIDISGDAVTDTDSNELLSDDSGKGGGISWAIVPLLLLMNVLRSANTSGARVSSGRYCRPEKENNLRTPGYAIRTTRPENQSGKRCGFC